MVVDETRLWRPQLVSQPRADERSDEAQRDGDQAAAARSAGDCAADSARDRRDQEVDQERKEGEVHFGRAEGLSRACEVLGPASCLLPWENTPENPSGRADETSHAPQARRR